MSGKIIAIHSPFSVHRPPRGGPNVAVGGPELSLGSIVPL